ncbi:PH domain-containing protein [Roseivirga sp.]|uniref:PH domain-containing protein n=1 Tax=Roseivirga sp. TaxID=1964215 RepID=UPI003B5283A8
MESISKKYAAPSRQSKVAIGIILIKFIRFTIRSFWPILLSFFIGRKVGNSFENIIGYIALGVAALNLIGSVLTYFRFYFHLEEGAIVIDKGVLKRSKTNIPFERIQTINLQQNLLHQIFNVVSLEIDTAGAKKSELTIDALDKEDAEALRKFILEEKDQLLEETESTTSEVSTQEVEEETLLELGVGDLIKVGVSQNHLRSMAILFAFVFSTLNEITDDVSDMVQEELSGYQEAILNNGWILFAGSVIIVAIISFVYSLINTVLKNFELKLTSKKSGLKLVRGLLNREEISINKSKVQTISWSDNPLRMMFKMFTIQIEQASSAQADQLKSKIRIPGGYKDQVKSVLKIAFAQDRIESDIKYRVSILLKYRIIIFSGLLPALIATAIGYFQIGYQGLWFLAWIPLVWLSTTLYYKKRSFELDDHLLQNNRGTFGHHFEVIPLYKVQAVSIKQSWYQRRKELATVKIHTAAGSLNIPFIPVEQAEALENLILYKVESDQRKWM